MKTKFGNVKLQSNGYYVVTTRKEGNNGKYLHRLLYEDFYGEIPEGYEIHHKNGNKLDNCILNLQLASNFEHVLIHSNNKSGYYRVSKQPDTTCKQGFIWHYRYWENNTPKAIASVNLKRLEKKVIEKGLPWKKLEGGMVA